MALSAPQSLSQQARRYTYADLAAFPVDHMRREIIDGELFVNPSPVTRHQLAAMNISGRLFIYPDELLESTSLPGFSMQAAEALGIDPTTS